VQKREGGREPKEEAPEQKHSLAGWVSALWPVQGAEGAGHEWACLRSPQSLSGAVESTVDHISHIFKKEVLGPPLRASLLGRQNLPGLCLGRHQLPR
jgi:hypothetical protein